MSEEEKQTVEDQNTEDQNTEDQNIAENNSINEDENIEAKDKIELTAEEHYAELNDKYIRIHAEFDNYRKRTNKEKIDIIGSANSGILKDLLPVMDDFDRAIKNNLTSEDLDGVKEGFNLIFNKFKAILEGKGLKPMNSNGEVFDVEIHEAIANVPAPTKKQKGKVIDAVEKGYYLNDKVIRFAKVVVGQ
jgi:molecular chaperone GrpE